MVDVNLLTASYMMRVCWFPLPTKESPFGEFLGSSMQHLGLVFFHMCIQIISDYIYYYPHLPVPYILGTKLPVANILSNLTLVPNK